MLIVKNENFGFSSEYAQTFVMLKDIDEESEKQEDAQSSQDNSQESKTVAVNLRLTQDPEFESNIKFMRQRYKSNK